ncbi:deoxyribose-phosphate aldolase [Microlunatus flavus]|uniref:Deoxyribose-phosphate aldolase n=1 Tax=Microlunatus flavus TaxID=1036181 RepID=A0A1H9C240_9ACTN|nr:deoxyribose-phosphate aldolase [Microlunatus flavus]SEP94708.1 deoxyribose-phosphate aldolase [Microlunatus flavus]
MTTYAARPDQAPETAPAAPPSTATATPAPPALPSHLAGATADEATLRRFLFGLPAVDPVGLEQRSATLATRSIKKASKLAAIDLAISMVDLTTLEGADTPGKVRNLARKALAPDPARPGTPQVAAVCVYPDRVATAADELAGSDVKVASVATAFPSGRSSLEVKLADTRLALESGADEIDMVIDRGAFLAGQYGLVLEQIRAVKAECAGRARLKVILETGELATYDNVRRACWLALLGGGDFLKTSTGKVNPAATLPLVQVLLQAVRDWRDQTGQQVAVKPAGGIRTTKDAIRHLVAVNEVAGPEWLDPHWFRFGASSLLDDLVLQRRAQLDGHYADPDTVALD